MTLLTRVFSYKKMYGRFARRPKKRGRSNKVMYYRGGRKAGFHRNYRLKANCDCLYRDNATFQRSRESPLDTAEPQKNRQPKSQNSLYIRVKAELNNWEQIYDFRCSICPSLIGQFVFSICALRVTVVVFGKTTHKRLPPVSVHKMIVSLICSCRKYGIKIHCRKKEWVNLLLQQRNLKT